MPCFLFADGAASLPAGHFFAEPIARRVPPAATAGRIGLFGATAEDEDCR